MAAVGVAFSRLLENRNLNFDPTRYSTLDIAAAPVLNYTTSWFGECVPFVGIESDRIDIRLHDGKSAGRDAQFYLNNGVTGITAVTPYVPVDSALANQQVIIKQICAQYDDRDYTRNLQSDTYKQMPEQKLAMGFAANGLFEWGCFNANSGINPEEFDGLTALTSGGLGQTLAAATSDFRDFTAAMQLIKSHNRSVDLIVMNQDAWRKVDNLARTQGYELPVKRFGRKRRKMVHFNDIPICISDHIPTSLGSDTTTIFFMTLGQPNGVFAIVNRHCPGLKFYDNHREDSPFLSVQAFWGVALVSTTDHALVQLNNWSIL